MNARLLLNTMKCDAFMSFLIHLSSCDRFSIAATMITVRSLSHSHPFAYVLHLFVPLLYSMELTGDYVLHLKTIIIIFFCFVCHMFCCLVGLLCAARSFLKHTSATVHNCCCWCLLFSYVSQHKYAIDSLLNAIFIKMPHFGGKCWKREKQAILELTHGHRSHIQMPNVVQPEHINWVLQSAFDSNQSCD